MLDELQDKVGEQIAKMTHAEAATVTSGAFSAMTWVWPESSPGWI